MIASTSNASRENSLTFEIISVDNPGEDTGNWDAEKIYNKSDKVVVNGVTYEAQWWTQGDTPSNSNVWERQ